MKKFIRVLLSALLVAGTLLSLSGCGEKSFKIAVPNDPTNEQRALQLLESKGLITLKKNLDTSATIKDIESNPYNIEFVEAEAALVPQVLKDVDYAVINSNYAIGAGLTPFTTEGTDVSFPNIIAVKDGNETSDKIMALAAAVNSKAVKDFIETSYKGAIVCDLEEVYEDGFDPTVDYAALSGTTIKIAASPVPHADILKIAKEILAKKNVTLQITEFDDYVQPNMVVETGEYDANYFQHIPYLIDFNNENRTHVISILKVHHEPMGIYSSKYEDLDAIKSSK